MLLEIWLANQAKFRSIIRSLLFDHSLIEDILQETFSRVLRGRTRFSSEQEALNYLKRSVINTTIDNYRRRRREVRFLRKHRSRTDTGRESELGPTDEQLTRLIAREQSVDTARLIREVSQAMKGLTPEQKNAIEAFFSERNGKNMKEVCKEAGVPYSTLRSRMLSGIDQIRKALRENGHPGFDQNSGDEQ